MKEDETEKCKQKFNSLAEKYAGIDTQIAELKGLVRAKICSLQKITSLMNELTRLMNELTKQIEDEITETNKI